MSVTETERKPTAASTIVRAVAAQMWSDVQTQQKIAPGVFGFSCAGHGGIVALVDQLDLPEHVIQAARDNNLVHLVVRIGAGHRTNTYTEAAGYRDLQQWAEHQQALGFDVEIREVWIGEEDCDWATLIYASEQVRENTGNGNYFARAITQDEARRFVEQDNAEFLAAIEPEAVVA